MRVLPILASPDVLIEALPRWIQKIQLYRLGFDPTQLTKAKNWTLFINDRYPDKLRAKALPVHGG